MRFDVDVCDILVNFKGKYTTDISYVQYVKKEGGHKNACCSGTHFAMCQSPRVQGKRNLKSRPLIKHI